MICISPCSRRFLKSLDLIISSLAKVPRFLDASNVPKDKEPELIFAMVPQSTAHEDDEVE
jgi:hypothetical protein